MLFSSTDVGWIHLNIIGLTLIPINLTVGKNLLEVFSRKHALDYLNHSSLMCGNQKTLNLATSL